MTLIYRAYVDLIGSSSSEGEDLTSEGSEFMNVQSAITLSLQEQEKW